MEEEKISRFNDLGHVYIPRDIRRKIYGKTDVFYKAVIVTVNDKNEIVLTPYEEEKNDRK